MMSRNRPAISSNMAGVGKYGLHGMQKSTGPAPSPPSRVSAAIDGLCAAVLRNSEVTLSAKGASVWGGLGGDDRARRLGWPARGSTGRPYIRRLRWHCSAAERSARTCVPPVKTVQLKTVQQPNECTVVVRYVCPGF